jgi:hypothetical protein
LPAVNTLLFSNSPALHVRDVTLLETDSLQTHRERLACGFRRNPAGYSDLMPAGIPI